MMTSPNRTRKYAGVVRQAVPLGLPLISIVAALLAQAAIQQIIPGQVDFPYAFFYLIAAFASAWFGGYASGTLACLLTTVGFPLIVLTQLATCRFQSGGSVHWRFASDQQAVADPAEGAENTAHYQRRPGPARSEQNAGTGCGGRPIAMRNRRAPENRSRTPRERRTSVIHA